MFLIWLIEHNDLYLFTSPSTRNTLEKPSLANPEKCWMVPFQPLFKCFHKSVCLLLSCYTVQQLNSCDLTLVSVEQPSSKVALYEKNKNKNQTKLWLVKVPCHMLDSLKANQSSDGVQWTPNLPKRQSREQAWNSSSTFISVFTLKKSGRGSFDVFKGEGVRRNCSIFIRHHEACISLSAPQWVTYRTSTWICSFMTMINNDYYLYYYWWNKEVSAHTACSFSFQIQSWWRSEWHCVDHHRAAFFFLWINNEN